VTWNHERVEELLAGLALGGLDPEDQALAERALLEHVPACERCRRALEGYRLVAGDLALAAEPVAPPEILLARVRRSIGSRRRRWRPAWATGAAAGLVVLGLSAWNLVLAGELSGRLSETQRQQGWLVDAMSFLGDPNGEVLDLPGPGQEKVSVLYVPGEEGLYVIASELPDPRWAYHVWFLSGEEAWRAGILEVSHGSGMVPIRTDAELWDVVMITDEPRGGGPSPEASPVVSATVD
jgi:hypothetical protein